MGRPVLGVSGGVLGGGELTCEYAGWSDIHIRMQFLYLVGEGVKT